MGLCRALKIPPDDFKFSLSTIIENIRAMTDLPLPSRHERWYFKDGSFIIRVSSYLIPIQVCDSFSPQAENKLYNVYGEMLCNHSLLFNDMLSLPQPSGAPVHNGGESESFRAVRERACANGEDGSSDSKALVVPHTSYEFECLLECVFWE
jgi:hypothetical protein